MNIIKKTFLLFSAMLLVVNALSFSQDNTESGEQGKKDEEILKFTLMEAVDYALDHSKTLKVADIDLEMKKRASQNGWNCLLPSVNVSATMSRSNEVSASLKPYLEQGVYPNDGDAAKWTRLASLGFEWQFTAAYIQKIRAAKAAYEDGQISFQDSINQIEVNVKKAFYGLLLQKKSLDLSRTTLENSRQRMVQAQTNFKNGLVPELAMLQTQVAYQNMRPTVAQSERVYKQNLDGFAILIGVPVGTEIELVGNIEPYYVDLDYDNLISKYGDNSLAIKSLDKKIEQVKLGISATGLGTWSPALVIGWTKQPMSLGAQNDSWSGFPSGDNWSDNGSLNLTVAWNLTNMLPWSANRQSEKDLRAQLAQLEINRELLLENQKRSVRSCVDTLIQCREQITAMNRNISLAQRSYDMTVRAYRNGTTELLEVRDAENSLTQAKIGLESEKLNYISALMDLESTLNTKLTGGEK